MFALSLSFFRRTQDNTKKRSNGTPDRWTGSLKAGAAVAWTGSLKAGAAVAPKRLKKVPATQLASKGLQHPQGGGHSRASAARRRAEQVFASERAAEALERFYEVVLGDDAG